MAFTFPNFEAVVPTVISAIRHYAPDQSNIVDP